MMRSSHLHHPLILLAAILFLSPSQADARWASIDDAEVVMESNVEKITVKADGSWEMERETEFSILKEKGIDELKLVRMVYDPNTTTYAVLEAKSTTGAQEQVVAPASIENKELASTDQGIGRRNQITIPFSGLQVGSRVKFKVKSAHKPAFVPGYFHFTSRFGLGTFARKDEFEIVSEVPLHVKTAGTDQLVAVTESREGNLYKVKAAQTQPLWREVVDEPKAVLATGMVPQVEVSSVQDWKSIAVFSATKVEQAMLEPLPPELLAIVEAAGKKATDREKIELVMGELISKVKYLGDWRSEKNYHFPRTLAEIASSKQGDCKDFSLATSVMLRKLGMQAKVAWVHRGLGPEVESRLAKPLLPDLTHFNHAIVALEHAGKKYWLDPTNAVAHAGDPMPDISDRYAFVVDATRADMDLIPASTARENRLEARVHYSFVGDVMPDAMARVKATGPSAALLASMNSELSKQKAPDGIVTLRVVDPERKPVDLKVIGKKKEGKAVDGEFSEIVTYTPIDSSQPTSMGYAFEVPRPRGMEHFMVPADGRVSNLGLGQPGSIDFSFVFSGMSVKGDVPKGCTVASRWGKASRVFEVVDGGVLLTDKAENLVKSITADEMRSPEFRQFQAQMSRCFSKATLFYTFEPVFRPYVPNDPARKRQRASAKLLNTIIDDRKASLSRAETILNEPPETANYALARLLLADYVLENPENPVGYAWLALSILFSIPADGDFRDPTVIEAARTIVRTARNEKMNAPELDVLEGIIWLYLGNAGKADALLKKALKEKPSLSVASLMLIMMHTARAEPRGQKHDEYLVMTTNGHWGFQEVLQLSDAALADPKQAAARRQFLQHRVHALLHLGKLDEAEKTHETIVKENPKSASALLSFAGFLHKFKKIERATELAKQALEIEDVPSVRAVHTRFQAELAEKKMVANPDDKDAAEIMEAAARENVATWKTYFFLANHYHRRGVLSKDPQTLELEKKHTDAYLTKVNSIPGRPYTSAQRDKYGDLVNSEIKTTPKEITAQALAIPAPATAAPAPSAAAPAPAANEPARAPASMGPPAPPIGGEATSQAPAPAPAPTGQK